MNCKKCNAELGEDYKLCPYCGEPVDAPEQGETPVESVPAEEAMQGPEIVETKKNTGKIALSIAAIVVVLAVLIAVIVGGMGGEEVLTGNDSTIAPTGGTVEATDAAEEATEGTIPPDGNPDDVTCKGSYTASDEELIAAADNVVATMGEAELTVGELEVYYWAQVFDFMYYDYQYYYGNYAAYVGLDYAAPLDTQSCAVAETPMTWQQYFLDSALNSWIAYQSMALEANANGHVMNEEAQATLDSLEDDLTAQMESYGYESLDAMLHENFGASVDLDAYRDHMETYYTAYSYYNELYEAIEPSAEEVEAYFAENEAVYAESGITKDTTYVDVRHILVMPEGGTTDEETGETTYSDEEWEAARSEAQAILDEWLAGDATEDTFAELANQYTDDGNDADYDGEPDGGLYTDVYVGQMVESFENWCFDESRQSGDYGLVQTEYGYHVMYFVNTTEDVWYTTAEGDLIYEMATSMSDEIEAKYPAEIDYSAIVLSFIDLS